MGLLNHAAPATYGGAGLARPEDRRLHEVLAGACFNTWLVWAQHAPLVGRLAAAGAPRSELADRVLRGEVLLGAGISDVRRFPERYVAACASRAAGASTASCRGSAAGELHAALDRRGRRRRQRDRGHRAGPVGPGTRATPLELGAVAGSRTERVRLVAVHVPDEHVIATESLAAWRRGDLDVASDARPHHFGLAQTVLAELAATGDLARRRGRRALGAAGRRPAQPRLRPGRPGRRGHARRRRAVPAPGPAGAQGRHRRGARAADPRYLVARRGHGLAGDDTAQLHARSALFCQVQGQSGDVRRAQLTHLAALAG